MNKRITTTYFITEANSDYEYGHMDYAEMIIHLFQLHTENPKADYYVKWYKDEITIYSEEDARKGGYCVMGEEDAWDADPRKTNPALGEYYPYLENKCNQIDVGTYELDILGKYQIKEEVTA
jgi:hypothetical protein